MLISARVGCSAVLLITLGLGLTGCIDPHGICGLDRHSEWSYLRHEPSDATELRAIAAKQRQTVMPGGNNEYWFRDSRGAVQVCYSSPDQMGPYFNHYSLVFWREGDTLKFRDASQFFTE